MILRRTIDHLRTQNWTAVALELLIVVIGVFLGFQLNDWNAGRLEGKRAQRLEAVLRLNMAWEYIRYGHAWQYGIEVIDNGENLLADLDGSRAMEDEEFVVAAFRATQVWINEPNRAAYDEITATGGNALIRDRELWVDATRAANTDRVATGYQAGLASPYRRFFREAVPIDIVRDARRNCGDRAIAMFDAVGPDDPMLNLPCQLTASPAAIAQAARALRDDPRTVPLLRLQVADRDQNVADLEGWIDELSRYRLSRDRFDALVREAGR